MKEDWEVEFTSRDLSTLRLRTKCPNQEQDRWIKIHNAYNPPPGNRTPQESVIPKLRTALDAGSEHIVVGDFNLHHPLWAGPRQLDQHEEADDLIDVSITNALDLLTPQGIKTWKTSRSAQTLDLAWASWTLSGFMEGCRLQMDIHHDSDHFPIATTFNLKTNVETPPPKRAWNQVNKETFVRYLQQNRPALRPLQNTRDLDGLAEDIHKAIQCQLSISGFR